MDRVSLVITSTIYSDLLRRSDIKLKIHGGVQNEM